MCVYHPLEEIEAVNTRRPQTQNLARVENNVAPSNPRIRQRDPESDLLAAEGPLVTRIRT
jgi:hypothetical protein